MGMSIGARLKRWRESAGLTQREAADRVGISQSAWHAIETDAVKRFSVATVSKIVAGTEGTLALDDFFPRRVARTG